PTSRLRTEREPVIFWRTPARPRRLRPHFHSCAAATRSLLALHFFLAPARRCGAGHLCPQGSFPPDAPAFPARRKPPRQSSLAPDRFHEFAAEVPARSLQFLRHMSEQILYLFR